MTTEEMSEKKELKNSSACADSSDDEINLLEYLLIIVKHKKMILGSMAVTFLLACGLTLLMPNIFTSTARILPPKENQSGLGNFLSGGMGDLAVLAGVSVSGGSGDLYVGMLQSRSIADAIIDRFNLMEIYEQKYRVTTYKVLSDHVTISIGKKDGIISVSVDDKDPERAARMANAYVEELKKLNIQFNLNNAGRERNFLEERLAVVRNDLVKSEDALKEFQEKNKAIKIDEQATAIIEAIAQLKAELASNEVQLGVLLSYQTEQNPQVKSLRESIAQLKAQISKLEKTPAGKSLSDDIFMVTSAVPELGIQYARLVRNFKVQETLFELLTKQYEIAKINEAKNTSTIQVLDPGNVPDKKSKPSRILIVIALTFTAGFFSLIYSLINYCWANLPEDDRKNWKKIKEDLGLRT